MKQICNITLKANITVTVRDLQGNVKDVRRMHNLAVDAGKNFVRDVFSGAETSGLIKYLAYGTDNTAVAAGQTALLAETGRKAVTQYVNGTTGVVTVRTILTSNDANGVSIEELGLYGGSAATLTVGSGTLIARALYSHTKLNTESIQMDWEMTIG